MFVERSKLFGSRKLNIEEYQQERMTIVTDFLERAPEFRGNQIHGSMKPVLSKAQAWGAPLMMMFLLSTACQSSRNQAPIRLEPLVNQEIPGEYGEPILVGKIDRQGLAGENYRYWFEEAYQAYVVDAEALAGLEPSLGSLQFMIFLGTWCSDSQRELPHFYKIADYLGDTSKAPNTKKKAGTSNTYRPSSY